MMMVVMTAAETVSMTAAELGIIEGCDDGASVPTMDPLSSEPSLPTKNLHFMRAVLWEYPLLANDGYDWVTTLNL
jgi:hypothetical protein